MEPQRAAARYFVTSMGRYVRLNVSTSGIKIIDRDGIEAVVGRLRARGITL
jgi:large subunit ribosomal protein L28